MRFYFLFILTFVVLVACRSKTSDDQTIRSNDTLQKSETIVSLPLKGKYLPTHFTNLLIGGNEYFTYAYNYRIYMVDLNTHKNVDSITILADTNEQKKYGFINSFCFNGKDSLFVALNNAILFVYKKQISKIIPINDADTVQYNGIMFYNLQDAPIYFDKKNNEIIGEIICSGCAQSDKAWYTQKILGHISLTTNKLSLYNISSPDKYINNYYGFGNHVYTDSHDSIIAISFPYDEKVYLLNRNSNTTSTFWAKSKYQITDADTLPLTYKHDTEQKMKLLMKNPSYEEIRFDPYNKLFYRFFRPGISLKKKDGKYNNFLDKKTFLMVINADKEVVGEYELDNNYQKYFSFIGKSGFYIMYRPLNSKQTDSITFKILTFKK